MSNYISQMFYPSWRVWKVGGRLFIHPVYTDKKNNVRILSEFFRTHIRNFSLLSGPLNKLTRKDCPWQGGQLPPEALKAYQELKHLLVSEPIVDYPRKNRPYSLIVDAATGNDINDGGLGAILTQTGKPFQFKLLKFSLKKYKKRTLKFIILVIETIIRISVFN